MLEPGPEPAVPPVHHHGQVLGDDGGRGRVLQLDVRRQRHEDVLAGGGHPVGKRKKKAEVLTVVRPGQSANIGELLVINRNCSSKLIAHYSKQGRTLTVTVSINRRPHFAYFFHFSFI